MAALAVTVVVVVLVVADCINRIASLERQLAEDRRDRQRRSDAIRGMFR